ATAAHEVAEHLVEDVREARGEAEVAGSGAAAAVLESGVAKAVVGRALLIVLQDVIGLADVLELLLCRLVPGIAVGVPLHGELAVGLLEILGAAPLRYTEQLVKILLSHRRRSPTPAPQSPARSWRRPGAVFRIRGGFRLVCARL